MKPPHVLSDVLVTLSALMFLVGAAVFPALADNTGSPAADVSQGYLRIVCASSCASKAGGRDVVTYDTLNACVSTCINQPSPADIQYVNFMRETCSTSRASGYRFCGIAPVVAGRDVVQYAMNAKLHPDTGCPAGATLPSGGDCQCPAGTELDNLHTVCLNADNIKENLKTAYDFLPDDIQKSIQNKMGGDLGVGIANLLTGKQPADFFADYVYRNVFHDTLNFRRLVKMLGASGIKDLVKKMLSDVGVNPNAEEPKTAMPPPPAAPANPLQDEFQNLIDQCGQARVKSGDPKYSKSYVPGPNERPVESCMTTVCWFYYKKYGDLCSPYVHH